MSATPEVVTRALVRTVAVPHPDGVVSVALITLDNGLDHTRPSTFGVQGLASLDAAADQVAELVAAGLVQAVAVTGKPYIFAVGADLSAVGLAIHRDLPLELGRTGHRVFSRFSALGVPSVAFVNGAAMGGGLELALHCDYRTLSSGAAALSFPECFLGLVPGWGGAWLLPHLIGPAAALKVIIENPLTQNRQLNPAQAAKLGIVDVMFDPADFLERSLDWTAGLVRSTTSAPSRRGADDPVMSAVAWTAACDSAQAMVSARLHGAAPAAERAVELVRAARTATRGEGFAAEDEALADLVMSDELRAGLYAFDLVQKRAKRPVGVPDKSLARPITKVGVVGAGLMAAQMALLFAERLLVPVVMTDLDQARVDRGLGWVNDELDQRLAAGRINPDKAGRLRALITGSLSPVEAFGDADWVIEAVFEELGIKQKVLADLEQVVSPTTVLATNTSSLSVGAMAAGLLHPERVVGFHFFNPVAIMPLVEIVRAEHTDDATVATAFAVGKTLKKSCVLVADRPAFVVNRLLTRFLGEVLSAVDNGADPIVADHALDALGLPITPFNLLALVGPAVAHHVAETLHEAFPDRFVVSPTLGRIVASGKTAVYRWTNGVPSIDPEVEALLPTQRSAITGEQVRAAALAALAQEVDLMLAEGVVAEAADIDLCMLLGAGWPFHLGGITPYLDRSGTSQLVLDHRFAPPGVATLGDAG